MIIYYFIFFIIVLLFYVSLGRKTRDVEIIYLQGTMIFLAFFVGLSDMLGGYDRYIYAELFDDAADIVSKGQPLQNIALFSLYPKETGYTWFNIILSLITSNRYIFILLTTFIIYSLLFLSFKRYCHNYPFAVILFLGLWFFFTFTYLRQVLGATICWLGIQYIIDRKMWRFLLVWFIGYKFHNSALIFLPIYFIPMKKFDRQVVIKVMVACFLIGLTGLPSALFAAYGEVDNSRAHEVGTESGFRLPYLVEAVFFLYIILSKYHEIPERKLNIILCNMAIVFCGILLFFIKSENGGRLSWYYMIGVISTITYLSTHTGKNKNYALLMIVTCFFLFNRIVNGWGIQLSPYKTFLTNGVREGDMIEVKYEYDHNYDRDKFYRPALWFLQ